MLIPVCSWDGHFWPRKKHLFYVGWGRNGDMQRYRLRFCPAHVLDVQEHLAEYEVGANDTAVSRDWSRYAKCVTCAEPVDEHGWQVFVTGYPTQDERKDYWGYLHVSCQMLPFLQDLYSNTQSAS